MQPTLVVLAAGMGSRFGGLKQMEGVGPDGELILDYSVYDAIRSGFEKVVFVIRHDIADAFRERVGDRLARHIPVAYAYQEMDACLPVGADVPPDRTKPWGTGHALLVAKDVVDGPFVVINADDFYGAQSYQELAAFLMQDQKEDGPPCYALAGFPLRNTLSDHGHVSRGVCTCRKDGTLAAITERTRIERNGAGALATEPDGSTTKLSGDERVSMNMWAFEPCLFAQLEPLFLTFLAAEGATKSAEFYLPSAIDSLLQRGEAQCKVLSTDSHWAGMTYREDLAALQTFLLEEIAQGAYPGPLWG